MLDLSDYQTLIALIEEKGVVNAAKRLHRVPSAISTRLQLIEDELGSQLFIREKKKMIPTSAARLLYDYAQKIVALHQEALSLAKADEPGGSFRLGALDSMASTRLPFPLARLIQKYPNVELELSTGNSRPLYEKLLSGELDAILAADLPEDLRLHRFNAFEETLVFISKADHKPIRTPEDVRDDVMLAFKDGCSYRGRMFSWFNLHCSQPSRIIEMHSYHAILGAVSAGMGIGIIPLQLLETFPAKEALRIHPIEDSVAKVKTELLWRKNQHYPNVKALIECFEETRDSKD